MCTAEATEGGRERGRETFGGKGEIQVRIIIAMREGCLGGGDAGFKYVRISFDERGMLEGREGEFQVIKGKFDELERDV